MSHIAFSLDTTGLGTSVVIGTGRRLSRAEVSGIMLKSRSFSRISLACLCTFVPGGELGSPGAKWLQVPGTKEMKCNCRYLQVQLSYKPLTLP